MSSFGAARSNKVGTRTNNSPNTSSKRKPFAPSSVKVDMSGPPPPLPPVKPEDRETRPYVAPESPPQQDQHLENTDDHCILGFHNMSCRWLHLTAALWNILVVDANRSVDKLALRNMLDAIEWRISGQVTEQEFYTLYNEWMAYNYPTLKRKICVGVACLRHLCAEMGSGEGELDLTLGVLLYENSRSLLNKSLSFSPSTERSSSMCALEVCSRRWIALADELFFALDTAGYGYLQFDQVFFLSACLVLGLRSWSSIDEVESDLSVGVLTAITSNILKDASNGHSGGSLSAISLASTSLTDECNSWSQDLSRRNAVTLVRLASKDNTFSIPTSPSNPDPATRVKASVANTVVHSDSNRAVMTGASLESTGGSATCNSSKLSIGLTAPLFKSYLIRMGVGEAVLGTLLQHIRETLALITDILSRWSAHGYHSDSTEVNKSVNLKGISAASSTVASCCPVELSLKGWSTTDNEVVGPPRMWQYNVMRLSGKLTEKQSEYKDDSPAKNIHSDARDETDYDVNSWNQPLDYRHSVQRKFQLQSYYGIGSDDPLPSILPFLMTDGEKLLQMPMRAFGEMISAFDAQSASAPINGMQVLHSSVWKLVSAFKRWGVANSSVTNIGTSYDPSKTGGIPPPEIRKDPIYQFILAVLTEYKTAQLCLCSAFVEAALNLDRVDSAIGDSSKTGIVALACASLLPKGEAILKEYQSYEKAIAGSSALSESNISSPTRRRSMINRKGSNWEAFSENLEPTLDRKTTVVPSEDVIIHMTKEPLIANVVAPARRTSAPRPASSDANTILKVDDGSVERIASTKPFTSVSALFSEVSVSGTSDASGSRGKDVLEPSAPVVLGSPSCIEESESAWGANEVTLISSANWKSAAIDQMGSPAQMKSKNSHNENDALSSHLKFNGNTKFLQGELKEMLTENNDKLDSTQQGKLNELLFGLESELGEFVQKNKSASINRMEEVLKTDQSIALTGNEMKTASPKSFSGSQQQPKFSNSIGEVELGSTESLEGEAPMDMSTASSVIELLQQGHSAGQYAQTLRDLLRRMSKKNSNLQLKTLEEIIKLGESIITKESQADHTVPLANSSISSRTARSMYGVSHGHVPSSGGLRSFKKDVSKSGTLSGEISALENDSFRSPPPHYLRSSEELGSRDYMDTQARSALLGEDSSPHRKSNPPKSRIISFMDEVVTDVGGSFPASNGGISRTAHVPGRAPGGSPPKNRNGGSGMSRGQKAKPPPVKAFGHHL